LAFAVGVAVERGPKAALHLSSSRWAALFLLSAGISGSMKWPSARSGRLRQQQLLASQESPATAQVMNAAMTTESKGTTTLGGADDPDGALSWLRNKLHNVDQRCNALQSDLKKSQQDCVTLDGSRRGLAACLASQEETLNSLRQELLRATLSNQALTNEKVDLARKLEEKDRQIADLRRQLAAKDRVMETQRIVLEEASQSFSPALRAKLDKNMSTIDARRNQYREELQVAREALSSLRTNFRYFRGDTITHLALVTADEKIDF